MRINPVSFFSSIIFSQNSYVNPRYLIFSGSSVLIGIFAGVSIYNRLNSLRINSLTPRSIDATPIHLRLPGGFKNRNNFCFAHALFQTVFVSNAFSKFLSHENHPLRPYDGEPKNIFNLRRKLQREMYIIRKKIQNHEIVDSSESSRLRKKFHTVDRSIPIHGQWDLNEFSDKLFKILQTPSIRFGVKREKPFLKTFTVSMCALYLNPNVLKRSEVGEELLIESIPLGEHKFQEISKSKASKIPLLTLQDIFFYPDQIPEYIPLQVSRFGLFSENPSSKNEIKLKNIDDLQISILGKKERIRYELIGSCCHNGSVGGGHYTANIKYPLESEMRWINCNDYTVSVYDPNESSKCNLFEEISRKGCFYLYERVK